MKVRSQETLANGARLICRFVRQDSEFLNVVLAHFKGDEYVVWDENTQTWGYSGGSYCQNLEDAWGRFEERVYHIVRSQA